jgi:hypothetical protein
MRAHEFLSQLIRQAQQSQGSVTVNIGSINIDTKPEPADVENVMDRDDIMIPPLQQKIEMMKKMTGVEQKNQEYVASDDDEPLDQ